MTSNCLDGFRTSVRLGPMILPARNSLPDSGENAWRVFEIVLLAEGLEMFDARVLALPYNHGALLPCRAVGERQIVGGGEDPCVGVVEEEREVLGVIVAVVSQDVEAGEGIGLFNLDDVLCER